jgi:hypothetical protein
MIGADYRTRRTDATLYPNNPANYKTYERLTGGNMRISTRVRAILGSLFLGAAAGIAGYGLGFADVQTIIVAIFVGFGIYFLADD